MRVSTIAPVLLVLTLFLAAACSGSGDESAAEPTPAATTAPADNPAEAPQPSDPEAVVVPDLTDTPIIEAFEALRANGLLVAISDGYSVGRVWEPEPTTMTPEPGQQVDPGSVVTLDLGGAPARFPDDVPNVEETVAMPDLVGMNLREAVERLEGLNLFWLVREIPALPPSDADHLFDKYRVISQFPEPDFELSVGLLADNPDTVLLFPELVDSP